MKTFLSIGLIGFGLTVGWVSEASPSRMVRLLIKSKSKIEGAVPLHANSAWRVIRTSEADKKTKIKQLSKNPKIEWVEEDLLYRIDGFVEASTHEHQAPSNDPLISEQWSLVNSQILEAWKLIPQNAKEVIVAVVDTGIALEHKDLAAVVFTNRAETPNNQIDDDKNGLVDDVHGWNFPENSNNVADDFNHGSHVSGIIGAVRNNHIGMAGIAKVKILPVRWMVNGSGWGSDAIQAIHYAVKMGARVINASWGGIGYSKALEDAVREAESKGVLFVASAGNKHSDNDTAPRHPANLRFSNVISVADLNEKDELSKTSNFGKNQVELGAPGTEIISAIASGGFEKMSGTSMAAAHVSGVAALVMSANPKLTGPEVKKILMETVIEVPSLKEKTITGGRINALAAVKRALELKKQVRAQANAPAGGHSADDRLLSGPHRLIRFSGDSVKPDRVGEQGKVKGLSLQFVRVVKGVETPIEGLPMKSQLHGNADFQNYRSDEKGMMIDSVCEKSEFTASLFLENQRYRVGNEDDSYVLHINAKCGQAMKYIFEEKSENSQPLAIWQVATRAEKKLTQELGQTAGFWKKQIKFVWPAKGDYYHWDTVHLTLGYQWDVVSHEMGHAIYDQSSMGVFGGGQHYIDQCYTDSLALSEGWASFYAAWLNIDLKDPDARFEYMVPRRAPIRIENVPSDVCGKSTSEWRVKRRASGRKFNS